MMKVAFRCIPLLLAVMGCVNNGPAVAEMGGAAAGMNLDAAIKEAAAQMGENIPGGTQIALVNVASSSAQLSEYVISRLEAALVNGKKLVVVDRANLDRVREEQGFQLSGEVDDNSAKAIGKLLGAGAIVTGAFADLGDVYGLTLKAINIETATVAVSYPADIAKSTRITTLLAGGGGAAGTRTAERAAAGGNTQAARTPAVPAAPAVPVYKIGDTGPAGGIVFYDKGVFTNGWRYLEAAPNDLVPLQWGASGIDINGTSEAVGSGKANTALIAAVLEQRGEDGAALFCAVLDTNGYKDWFLPSYGELDLMRRNLKLKGLGDFGNGLYWSSSQHTGNAWVDGQRAFAQRFSDGAPAGDMLAGGAEKTRIYSVRAIRQF
jgi:hypothetical protein